MTDIKIAKPFLKWAGGKTQLINDIERTLPTEITKEKFTYIEPFVGSGAVLFWMLNNFPKLEKAVINDINEDLINTYKTIASNPKELISILQIFQNEFHNLDGKDEEKKEYYYKKRELYNTSKEEQSGQAALFIFLNRTSFNGLYRVNKSNGYNVPMGGYKKPTICDDQNIFAVSNVLQKVEILCGDYEATLKEATSNSFFYFDPPHKPLSNTYSFNSYAKDEFNDEEQMRLRNFCSKLEKKGHKWLLSNSDVKGKDTNDNFFDEIYSEFSISRVKTRRSINANPEKRGELGVPLSGRAFRSNLLFVPHKRISTAIPNQNSQYKMNLSFNTKLSEGYSSNSQIARVLTENWVKENSYCPCCGELPLNEFENNRPVADFYCKKCNEEFELKSKNGKISNTINDGAYSTMISRINSNKNPNFFFLTYSKKWSVENFLIIPKQFFTTEIIIKRKPLSATAKRAGWIGCNIDISNVADAGKVFLVKDSKLIDQKIVETSFNKTLFLREKSKDSKGWILDLMTCIDLIKKETFTLEDVYKFEDKLKLKYPSNNFIKDKIRQQLQVLRDKGIIEFVSRGNYKKIKYGNI